MPLLSVVVPVYNELPTLAAVLQRVAETPVDKEIIVVDDGSTDGSEVFLRDIASGAVTIVDGDGAPARVRVLFHPENLGKGAALRDGFAAAGGDIILVQDADLEYDPNDYPSLIGPILCGQADVVYGVRFTGGPQRVHMFWHFAGNRFLTLLSNVLNDLNLSDMETGFKAFRRQVIDDLGPSLKSRRFGFEPEITAKVAKRGYRIYETPIAYHGRDYAAGKKITWRDGVAAVFHILRFRFLE